MNLFADIEPALMMGITVSRQWKNGIELCAPLENNRNDKGTGFAGSISSILTLAGWALMTRALHEAGIQAEVMVVKSETEFTAPVTGDFMAACETTDAETARVFQELETRGRSRIRLDAEIPGCARMTASYAVIAI
ncbi:YiiD C-terminal domain-containing protein [Pontiella agarivorans]|uniref:YiiD C-terminal domain-containing protein n=1 Tax=Pontiella agarivorans TaxID=3038953 RepID=A0ABU5MUX7_9BACT|nr:YiiD C-terminal domain-containing protein [Pontiella agarivorans]MDZ8118017.1 YiiD C-terminal domain-containing protein [Pontiella agarivorans]